MGGAKEFHSLEEVADLLGVHYQLIYKVVRSGELPAARIGKVYRVSRRDLEAYLVRSKSHASGGVCAACGKTYHSRLSLKHGCVECGESICVDCWGRKQIHSCSAHGGGTGTKSATQETQNN